MSAHGHAHDDHDDEHDDHDHHPVEPPLPEPESPAWLPLLGGALFLAALLLFLVTRANEPAVAEATAPSATGAAAAEPAPTPP